MAICSSTGGFPAPCDSPRNLMNQTRMRSKPRQIPQWPQSIPARRVPPVLGAPLRPLPAAADSRNEQTCSRAIFQEAATGKLPVGPLSLRPKFVILPGLPGGILFFHCVHNGPCHQQAHPSNEGHVWEINTRTRITRVDSALTTLQNLRCTAKHKDPLHVN